MSIIIPVYNRSRIIAETLSSICGQTYKKLEVIIIDDCSYDSEELKKVLEYYNQLNIKYFRHEHNLHGGAARNTGIELAKGDYVAFLDSDDVWAPTKIEQCIKAQVRPDEILYSQIMDREKVHPSYAFDNNAHVDEYLLVERQTMQTSSLFMTRDLANTILFDPSLTRFQDTDFIIRAQKKYNVTFRLLDEVLVYMTEDDKGARISSSVNPAPAYFWLNKIKPLLTNKSISVFTFNRIINYASNTKPRIELFKLFMKEKCYKYLFELDFKVFVKFILGSYQRKIRR